MARIAVLEHLEDTPSAALEHHAPLLMRAGMGFSRAVYQHTILPHRIIEAARYRTAQINGCLVCMEWRPSRDARAFLEAGGETSRASFIDRGDTPPDEHFYAAIETWRAADLFSDREQLAIEFAERMGVDPQGFDADEIFWTRMHDNFTDAEIVDLTLSISSWIAFGRVNHVLQTDATVCALSPLMPSA